MINSVWLIIGVIIAAVLIIIKFSNMKQNLALRIAAFLFLFFLLSFGYLAVKHDLSFSSMSNISYAGKVYIVWLGAIIDNVVKVSGYVLQQDWGRNITA